MLHAQPLAAGTVGCLLAVVCKVLGTEAAHPHPEQGMAGCAETTASISPHRYAARLSREPSLMSVTCCHTCSMFTTLGPQHHD